ncbi:hypothetical protein GTD74_003938, partial [Salmonella enterica subsp. enterica serovar -:r:1,5]|nr:hypothetical protein [Salmonella enterica]EDQ5706008.1 hypothetical protein [Salmonella enterica subsp. enterica serovar -:r:1,5]
DTSDVSGIRLWDPNSGRWVKRTFKLPIYNGEEVILIPKVLAREKIAYSHSKFYRRYIIPEIRAEHIKAGSALVTLLKGKQTVTAKKIIEEFGQSKGFIEEQIVKYPDAIKQYKEELLLSPPPPLPHKSFDDSTGAVTSPLSSDIENLKLSIKENDEQLYVDSLKKIFLTIFYPSLFYPCLISGNMNDYRFTMLNESRAGFFFDFSVFEIPAEKILVNIVMSSSHINENYLESLTQEMDVIKTSVCLLACCEATNELQKEKIKALAKSKGKYIFIINSVAINGILDEYYKIGEQHFSMLRDKFKELN